MIFYYKQSITMELEDFPRLRFVLSGFRLHLASHFGKSSSTHSWRYEISSDFRHVEKTWCFASYNLNSGSLVQYAG